MFWIVACMLFTIAASQLCSKQGYELITGYADKRPTAGIAAQFNVNDKQLCAYNCFLVNHTRMFFFNHQSRDCICHDDAPVVMTLETAVGYQSFEELGAVNTWMTSVVGVSSEYDSRYLATKMLGPPDIYPGYGDYAGSWCPSIHDDNQWIELGVSEPIYLKNVFIYETWHTGGVLEVSARDLAGTWHVLWTNPDVKYIYGSNILVPPFQPTDYKVDAIRVRIELSHLFANDWVELDTMRVAGNKYAPVA